MDPTVELDPPEESAPLLRLRRDDYQSRERRTRLWRIIIVTAFFAILIGGNLVAGASFVVAKLQDEFSTPDPGAKYKTARISRPMLDGVFCHNLVLDNKSGRSVEDKIERCDAANGIPARGQTQFIWGSTR